MGINTFVEAKGESVTYPWIGCSGDNDCLLVLFTRNGWGTVIRSENTDTFPIGKHKECWDMGRFKYFKGSITLENT